MRHLDLANNKYAVVFHNGGICVLMRFIMLDCHVHLERGEYTADWVARFADVAASRGINELWLLEHSYIFREFLPMYGGLTGHSAYIDAWFARKSGRRSLCELSRLADAARSREYPVKLRFGLEICYFPGSEELVRRVTSGTELDFIVGSVHYVDGFAYDHTCHPEMWDGVDVDNVYRRFFELSVELAQSGLFGGIAHPDCIKISGYKPSFTLDGCYAALADALATRGMYAEQNGGASRRSPVEPGMNPSLIAELKQRGVQILTASDAHRPEDAGAGIAELVNLIGKI